MEQKLKMLVKISPLKLAIYLVYQRIGMRYWLDLESIAKLNIDKLQDRADRGKLSGSATKDSRIYQKRTLPEH